MRSRNWLYANDYTIHRYLKLALSITYTLEELILPRVQFSYSRNFNDSILCQNLDIILATFYFFGVKMLKSAPATLITPPLGYTTTQPQQF